MKNISTSLLMAALIATSGFAVAQTPAGPATGKAEMKNLSEPPKAGTTSNTTRAEVKSEVVRPDASVPPKNLSEPPKPGTTSDTTRAEVKSEVVRDNRKAEVKNLSEPPKTGTASASASTSADRKAKRDERRAMNKSKSDMKMKSGSTAMPQAEAPTNK